MFFCGIGGILQFFYKSVKRTQALNLSSASGYQLQHKRVGRQILNYLRVIVEHWEKLKSVFHEIIDDKTSDSHSMQQARGYLRDMNSFEYT